MTDEFFFSERRNCELLRQAGKRWEKTPFHPKAQICQVGVDCSHVIEALCKESGIEIKFEWPQYRMSHGRHGRSSILLDYLRRMPRLREMSLIREFEIGDLVLFNEGMSIHHIGMMLSAVNFIHAVYGLGVIVSHIDDPTYGDKLEARFRVLK